MAIYTLAANERRRISVSSLYLNILSISGAVELESPSYGIKPIRVRSNFQLETPGIPEFYIINLENEANIVELQDSDLKMTLGGGGGVTVENRPVIQRIEEGINVNATATVTGGSFSVVSKDIFNPIGKITIAAGERALFAPARNALDRRVTLQIVTDSTARSMVNVGSDSTIDENKGILLVGNINAIAAYEVTNQSAVWVYNSGNVDACITGIEEYSTYVAPAPIDTSTPQTPIVNMVSNGTFEADSNNDGVPDNWQASTNANVSLQNTNLGSGNTLILGSN